MTADPDGERTASSRSVTRRDVVVALGGAAAASTIGVDGATAREAPLHVRVYPGPVPLRAWVRYRFQGMSRDWPPPYRAAMVAVEDAFEQVLDYARERSRLPNVDFRIERGQRVRFPLTAADPSIDAFVPTRKTVLDVFRDQVRERDVGSATTCHLLLCWAPFNFRLGYGGTHPSIDRIDRADGEGAYTAANVGATELWDSRAVTRNMAIHETLHTFISPDVAESVGGSPCDHNLGSAVRTDDALRVSPIATAYASPDRFDAGTRWEGRGCADHDRFHRHDGHEGIDRYAYTTRLSEATCEAVTRYLERQRPLS
ncbi:hypothetical protein ACFO5R_03370 [Halosolutus amylolyticus]|uniref:Uncharacterized protein n=1 Tax=Halosolutus amylolyticus TaxID=2932267 RepID=A0ABD5PKS8_9EURY|nr:hypothetical protein [Halosolutus amylolyticus]